MTLDLEGKIGLLIEFINNTKDINNLKYLYEWISRENKDYIKLKGPFSRIQRANEQFKQLAQDEENLRHEYNKLMLHGDYDPVSSEDFWNIAAEISRKRQGLEKDAKVTIYEEDIIEAKKKGEEKRIELRGKNFDYQKPLDILLEVVKKRVNVYLNPNNTNMIKQAYELIKPLAPFQPAPKKWKYNQEIYMEQQESARNIIRERVRDFFEYLGEYFQSLTKLIKEYPGEEFKPFQIKLEKHPDYKKLDKNKS